MSKKKIKKQVCITFESSNSSISCGGFGCRTVAKSMMEFSPVKSVAYIPNKSNNNH